MHTPLSNYAHVLFWISVFSGYVNQVDAHAAMTSPAPRTGMTNAAQVKFRGPTRGFVPAQMTCERFATPGPISATYAPGATVPLQWKVDIPHASAPGVSVQIQYAPGQPFEEIATGLDIRALSANVQLPPGKTSENAVLRWQWQTQADNAYYVGCADIAVVSNAAAPAG
ncbi:hypothetical protein HDV05_000632, partial [Chytridiales sp. JEL 0842]